MNQVVTILLCLASSLMVGIIAYYFFREHIKNEEKRRLFLLQKENQKIALPIRLQAYERMALFLERISPDKLLLRITPKNLSKREYETLLVRSIEEEFEHNLSQQVYMSENLWNAIKTAKFATIQLIAKTALSAEIQNASELSQAIFKEILEKETPTNTALRYLKVEIRELLG